MLDSRLPPKSSLAWQIAIPRSIILLILLSFIGANAAAQKLQNTTISVTTPQIIYTPFVCSALVDFDVSQLCSGAWQLSSSNDSVSTTGPTSLSGNFIPQLFFQFRASRLIMNALPSSNASVNISLSSGGTEVSSVFDSSLQTLSVVNLPQNLTTLLTVTYILSEQPTLFGLASFIITVPENASLSSLLPQPTLPTFSSLPSSTSLAGSSGTKGPKSTSKSAKIGIGIGVALILVILLVVAAVCLYRCGTRRRERIEGEKQRSGWLEEPADRISRVSGRSTGVLQ